MLALAKNKEFLPLPPAFTFQLAPQLLFSKLQIMPRKLIGPSWMILIAHIQEMHGARYRSSLWFMVCVLIIVDPVELRSIVLKLSSQLLLFCLGGLDWFRVFVLDCQRVAFSLILVLQLLWGDLVAPAMLEDVVQGAGLEIRWWRFDGVEDGVRVRVGSAASRPHLPGFHKNLLKNDCQHFSKLLNVCSHQIPQTNRILKRGKSTKIRQIESVKQQICFKIAPQMKKLSKVLDAIQEFDLFAPHITVRYKSQNDYKTFTGAFLSIALIIFFGVVFVNSFVDMINRKSITSTILFKEENDPSQFFTQTPTFMFAIGLTGIDMNQGDRYFNLHVVRTASYTNSPKVKSDIKMLPCTASMWAHLGDQYQKIFDRLKLSQWMCPEQGQQVELQGKYSSDAFKYLKISMSKCNGTVNGQGCRSDAQISNYLSTYESFSFNYYFANQLINPDQPQAVTTFLDDTNNFPFTTTFGASCNFFMQSYTIETDNSLSPVEEKIKETGAMSTENTAMTPFIPSQGEYLRFYVRKSPSSQFYSRKYMKMDELLSYIGGLFGLIAMVIQIPLTYYNICCFELSLATELFTYKKPPKGSTGKSNSNSIQPDQDNGEITNINLQAQSGQIQILSTTKDDQQPHSVKNFNFLTYMGYVPFFALKKLGWKSLQSQKFSPYYEAIKQVRRQIDLGHIIERFIYLDRVSKSLLEPDQRKLLHICAKQNINHFDEQRKEFKLRDKLKSSIKRRSAMIGIAPILINQIIEMADQENNNDVKEAFRNLSKKEDPVSRRIVDSIDPAIVQALQSDDEDKPNPNIKENSIFQEMQKIEERFNQNHQQSQSGIIKQNIHNMTATEGQEEIHNECAALSDRNIPKIQKSKLRMSSSRFKSNEKESESALQVDSQFKPFPIKLKSLDPKN